MDWKATLEEILAERRRRFGERPSTEDLIALRAGELPEDDRRRLLEQASVDREVARELFDVLRFPEPAGDEDPGGDEEGVGERWAALRDRLAAEGELPARRAPPAGPGRWLPLAATFVLGVAGTLAVDRLLDAGGPGTASEARVNLPIVELLPVAAGTPEARAPAEVVALAADAGGLVLALAAPAPVAPERGPYVLELTRGDGSTATFGGLRPGAGGVFVLDLPRRAWSDGRHELRLEDRGGREVARFRLEVELRR